jgi:tRNA threonylcarbamoyladenosine biosynthesis protein TsaE
MEVIFSLQGIDEIAKQVIASMGNRKVIALYGEMGVGKTTFTTAFCKALNVIDVVSSPTFSIINVYETADDKTIYHLDLYRLKDEEEAINAGVEDCLYSGNICLVEWPHKVPITFPEDTMDIKLEIVDIAKRRITF